MQADHRRLVHGTLAKPLHGMLAPDHEMIEEDGFLARKWRKTVRRPTPAASAI